ncbi:hypothetical protein PIB30_035437 [Stylosanthes scabra]|uniref:Uncharacterized protein n=1 Tax=Stylosanthes scabra TaxID=79078 RepID=A0ABU6SE41_9FABA|nr:hypothetical protein [Stylosanthes scabra]
MSLMIRNSGYPEKFESYAGQVNCFDVAEPDGLPVEESREKSAVWVLNWMAMGQSFLRHLHPKNWPDCTTLWVC